MKKALFVLKIYKGSVLVFSSSKEIERGAKTSASKWLLKQGLGAFVWEGRKHEARAWSIRKGYLARIDLDIVRSK